MDVICVLLIGVLAVLMCAIVDKLLFASKESSVQVPPPTMWKWPILGHLPRLDPKSPFKTVTDWGRTKLGPVFRLQFGPDEVIILNNYQAIREAFVKQGDRFVARPDMWLFMDLQHGQKLGISLADGQCWKEQRSFVVNALKKYGFSNSATMEDEIQKSVDDMITHLKFQVSAEPIIDLSKELRLCVGNVINTVLYGFKFERGDKLFDKFQRDLRQVLDLIGLSGLLMSFPILRHVPVFGYKKLLAIWKDMFGFHKEQIDKKLAKLRSQRQTCEEVVEDGMGEDFVTAYLREMEQRLDKTGHHFNMEQLKFIVADIWAGGQDTAATTLMWTILFMVKHPEVQDRIFEELKASGSVPTYRERARAPYTQAVLMEAQRLGNIIPFAITHGVTEDVKLMGYDIKKGSRVLPNLWAAHMDPDYFEQPDTFDPTRFLNEDGTLKTRVDSFIPYCIGRRKCMGETFSNMSMFKLLAGLVYHFEIKANPDKPPPTTDPRIGLVLDPQPFDVLVRNREW